MNTTSNDHTERLLWMAGFCACIVAAWRSEALLNATALAAAAGFCFRQAA